MVKENKLKKIVRNLALQTFKWLLYRFWSCIYLCPKFGQKQCNQEKRSVSKKNILEFHCDCGRMLINIEIRAYRTCTATQTHFDWNKRIKNVVQKRSKNKLKQTHTHSNTGLKSVNKNHSMSYNMYMMKAILWYAWSDNDGHRVPPHFLA